MRKQRRPAGGPETDHTDHDAVVLSAEEHDVLERLRRIEGQVRGLIRMISEGDDCRAVVTQLSAVRSALDRAALLYLAAHMQDCLSRKPSDGDSPSVDEMIEMFVRLG